MMIVLGAMLLGSCAALQPVSLEKNGSVKEYKHVYLVPTEEIRDAYYDDEQGRVRTEKLTPSDLIGARLLLRGITPVESVTGENVDQTLVVRYSERYGSKSFFSKTIVVTIEFTSARTGEVVARATAEEYGSTKTLVSDRRKAINRCMTKIMRD